MISSQRFWKMKRQLRQARKEIEAKQKALDFWIEKATTSKKQLEQLEMSAKIAETNTAYYRQLVTAKDESFSSMLSVLEVLTEENQRLIQQQAEWYCQQKP